MLRSLIYIALILTPIYGWGLRGHRIVGKIAELHSSKHTVTKIREILKGASLAKISNEADSLRSESKWKCASPLHYVSIEDGKDYFDLKGSPEGDIVLALVYSEDVLRDTKASPSAKRNALRWLVHLMGDLHQPLHVGRACDRGGNSVQVKWMHQATNLHRLWDSQLINYQELSYTEYAAFLNDGQFASVKLKDAADYRAWAQETMEIRPRIYQCFAGDKCCPSTDKICTEAVTTFGQCGTKEFAPELGYTYVEKNQEILDSQLALAGLRLARLLNRIFRATPLSKSETALRRKINVNRRAEIEKIKSCISGAQ
jgi:hypothetical protein